MQLKITSAGLAAATIAGSTGPKISFQTFKLGSAYGYTPSASDTGLNGSVVYTGTILSAKPYDAATVDVVIQLPGNAGPFNFGEIGLYLDDGVTMFAKAVYATSQEKLYDPSNGIGSQFTVHCLLKLADASASFNFTFNNIASIPVLPGSSVQTPDTVSSTCNAILGTDAVGNLDGSTTSDPFPILMTRVSSNEWAFEGYTRITASMTLSSTTGSPTTGGISPFFTQANGGVNVNRLIYIIQNTATGQYVPVGSVNTTTGSFDLYRSVSWLISSGSYSLYIRDAFAFEKYKSFDVPAGNGTGAPGIANFWSASDHVHPTDTTRAPLVSPALTGVPTAPTAATGTSTTQLATTAFVQNAISGSGSAVIGATYSIPIGQFIIKGGFHTRIGSNDTITFDTPFPTACINIQLTVSGTNSNSTENPQASSVTRFNFVATAGGNEPAYYWEAKGY